MISHPVAAQTARSGDREGQQQPRGAAAPPTKNSAKKEKEMTKRCVACGHEAADHEEGFIGASAWTKATGDQPLCHVDDHSCYVAAAAGRATQVNARVAAEGRCIMHNRGDDRPASVIIRVPIGNELPLCAGCWEWWQGTIADPAEADPANVPVWVRPVAAAVSS